MRARHDRPCHATACDSSERKPCAQVLVLHDQPGLSEAGVAALGGGLSRLRCLTLRQCDQVSCATHLFKVSATHSAQGRTG